MSNQTETDLKPSPVKGMKSKALLGSLWTLGGYGFSQLLRLGSHLVLAWLLTPQIFGLMALVKVVQQGLSMFSDVGIKPSIIQNRRGAETAFLNTAWTIQVFRGVALWICFSILSYPCALFFARNDPAAMQLLYILPVAGFGAVFQGLESTAIPLLNREMDLRRLTLLELATQFLTIAVIVAWATISPTVWSMVGGGLAGSCFRMIASHRIVPGDTVHFAWDRTSAKELFKFGKWIFLSTLFTFLALNLDKLVLGNFLSLGDLGLYSIAFVFAKVALHVAMRLGNVVLFPVFSRYRDEPERMMTVALKARKVVLWAGAGVCIVFAIVAPLFFELLWDPRYHEAGRIAQWLSLYIWTMVLLLTMDRIPLALGNSRALFVANVYRCIGIVFAISGYWWLDDLTGFILGLAVGPLISYAYLVRHIPFGRKELSRQSVHFTLAGLLYCLPAVYFLNYNVEKVISRIISTSFLATIPLAVVSVVVYRLVQKEMKKQP